MLSFLGRSLMVTCMFRLNISLVKKNIDQPPWKQWIWNWLKDIFIYLHRVTGLLIIWKVLYLLYYRISFVVMLLEHMLLLLLLLGNMCWYYQLYLMWICFALNLTKKKHKWLHQGLNLHPQNPFSHKFTTKLIIG